MSFALLYLAAAFLFLSISFLFLFFLKEGNEKEKKSRKTKSFFLSFLLHLFFFSFFVFLTLMYRCSAAVHAAGLQGALIKYNPLKIIHRAPVSATVVRDRAKLLHFILCLQQIFCTFFSLKQLIWYKMYSGSKSKVYFLQQTYSCVTNIHKKTNQTVQNFSSMAQRFCNILQLQFCLDNELSSL